MNSPFTLSAMVVIQVGREKQEENLEAKQLQIIGSPWAVGRFASNLRLSLNKTEKIPLEILTERINWCFAKSI